MYTDKLLKAYQEHGKIIVGVDFDDTIYPFSDDLSEEDRKHCEFRIELLKRLKKNITICLYTCSDEASLKYKISLMKEWGISPDYVNESPVVIGNGAKPYFNLLLDDKAGLEEATRRLVEFKNLIKVL